MMGTSSSTSNRWTIPTISAVRPRDELGEEEEEGDTKYSGDDYFFIHYSDLGSVLSLQEDLYKIVYILLEQKQVFIYILFNTTGGKNVNYYHRYTGRNTFLGNSQQVKDMLKGSMCQRVLSGHSHASFQTEIDEIVHTTLPGISEDNDGKPDGRAGVLDLETNTFKLVDVLKH